MSIKKIAEMTGASASTVARVLRDPDHKCSSELMKQKILSAAREIGYVPNEAAKLLKSGKNTVENVRRIYILLPRITSAEGDPFYTEMLRLTELEIRKNSCMVAGIWNNEQFSDEEWCKTADVAGKVGELFNNASVNCDGLIIIGKCCNAVLKELKRHEKNIVSIDRNSTNHEVDEVLCDGRKLAITAVDYLVRCGHKSIGYVGRIINESRFAGYRTKMLEQSLPTLPEHILETVPSEENGYLAMEYFMKLERPPTGIFCSNDILAIGMLHCAKKTRGHFRIPSIISADDIEEAQYTDPLLTTVSIPKSEMAHFAIAILLDRIKGGHRTISCMELEGTLVIRESCTSPSIVGEPEYYI
ncbi:MAG: LacI family DNA-binding transcriptional regulator [Oscillospiraceae bacterium]|nr:LacI family DNA-binding transcriptional regulator [Oscillospiraceae bacterium]